MTELIKYMNNSSATEWSEVVESLPRADDKSDTDNQLY